MNRLLTAVVGGALILSAAVFLSGSSENVNLDDCTVSDVSVDAEEQDFLVRLNEYRATKGAPAFTISHGLNKSATWKARDMADNDFFSHTDSLGRSPFAMQDDCGYNFNTYRAENILAVADTGARALEIWQNSAGHEAIQIDPNYKTIGISREFGKFGDYQVYYWVAEFGGHVEPRECPDYNKNGRIDIQDITSFLYPLDKRKLNTSLGDPNYDYRWDRIQDNRILINDITNVLPLGRVC